MKINVEQYKKMLKTGQVSVGKDGRLVKNKLLPEFQQILDKQSIDIPTALIPKRSNSFENIALLNEFEAYLIEFYSDVAKEVVFSKIMPVKRKFRADFLILGEKIIIEINGGQFSGGRHNRGGTGYERDLEKGNIAQKYGFKYYQFTYEMLERQEYKNILP